MPGYSSPRFFMVRAKRPHIRLTVLTSLVRSTPGILIMLFFQCMIALLDPINRKMDGIKWGLATYTVLVLSFVTALGGTGLHVESISYTNNHGFHDGQGVPPGPFGYWLSIWSGAIIITSRLTFLLNNWLADGLLVSPQLVAVFIRRSVEYRILL